MHSFITRKNIENYRRQLEQTEDEGQRLVLQTLLKGQEDKLASPERSKRDKPQS